MVPLWRKGSVANAMKNTKTVQRPAYTLALKDGPWVIIGFQCASNDCYTEQQSIITMRMKKRTSLYNETVTHSRDKDHILPPNKTHIQPCGKALGL